jgi:hypothetical protein
METLRLPSGATVEVERPRLAAVIVSGGSTEALVEAVWAHDMDADDLRDGDRRRLAEWCLDELADDDEAAIFAEVCHLFGTAPSVRLRIEDPVLAFDCDYTFASLLRPAKITRGE